MHCCTAAVRTVRRNLMLARASTPLARVFLSSPVRAMSGRVDAKLAELGHKLPVASKPVASYVMVTRCGNLLYTGERGCTAAWRRCGRGCGI